MLVGSSLGYDYGNADLNLGEDIFLRHRLHVFRPLAYLS